MRLAVMQPYIFPYIGYFQLINATDVFVFYDDVNFINKGWINRNQILMGNKSTRFTIPLKKASQNKLIYQIETNIDEKWLLTFFKSLLQSYSKAPYYKEVLPIMERVFTNVESTNIGELAARSVMEVCGYLDIKVQWVFSSDRFAESQNNGRIERLLHIAKSLKCDTYINAIGGKELYTIDDFSKEGIKLKFIKTGDVVYPQYSNKFVPNLSIIDLMMFNSKEQIHLLLKNYSLTD